MNVEYNVVRPRNLWDPKSFKFEFLDLDAIVSLKVGFPQRCSLYLQHFCSLL